MEKLHFWGITIVYIGAGVLLGALFFGLQQWHDNTLQVTPTPTIQSTATPTPIETVTPLATP